MRDWAYQSHPNALMGISYLTRVVVEGIIRKYEGSSVPNFRVGGCQLVKMATGMR